MTKDEALKMAIEALKLINEHAFRCGVAQDAIQACKEALEQPAQEPVALIEALSDLEHQQWIKWAQSIIDSEPISEARKQRWATMMVDYKDLPNNIQEYDREWARKVLAITQPTPSWQGLSDDEIAKVFDDIGVSTTNRKIYLAIEQALKEKNA